MDVISTKYLLGISVISVILIGLHFLGDDVSFSTLDANNDGLISYEEAIEFHGLQSKFQDVDLNKDGGISISEFNYSLIK